MKRGTRRMISGARTQAASRHLGAARYVLHISPIAGETQWLSFNISIRVTCRIDIPGI
jgi:hypothetical protein